MNSTAPQSASHQNLRILCVIRMLPLVGMALGAWYLLEREGSELRRDFIALLLLSFLVVVGFSWLRSYRARHIGQWEFLGHLVIDIVIYSLLMYNTGGAANPFVSYLLVPLTIAAITLPAALTWLVGLLCLTAYSLLLFWYVPLPMVSPGHDSAIHAFNPHLVGMWINFVASAVLIAYFINKMAAIINQQENALNRQQQQQLEDDQLLAVASLAASAAHELGTPLNTIKLVVDDWIEQGDTEIPPPDGDDIRLVQTQIAACQTTLKRLSDTARSYSNREFSESTIRGYFETLLDNWRVLRPDANATVTMAGDGDFRVNFHPSLSASLHNLLNNAADASPRHVEVDISWDATTARIRILDQGRGIGAAASGHGPMESDKPGGMGLGLFLARSILERHGASIDISVQRQGGTEVKVTLPLGKRP